VYICKAKHHINEHTHDTWLSTAWRTVPQDGRLVRLDHLGDLAVGAVADVADHLKRLALVGVVPIGKRCNWEGVGLGWV
jgi:hypothetical protein